METSATVDSINASCNQCGTKNRINLAQATTKTSVCGKCGSTLTDPNLPKSKAPAVQKESGIGMIQSFGLVSGALILLRYGLSFVSNPRYIQIAFLLIIATAVLSKTVRLVIFKAMILLFLVSTAFFCILNWKDLYSGKISALEAGRQIVRVYTGYGPIKDFGNQIKAEKYRNYVEAIDVRNEELNVLASRLSASCENVDMGCQAKQIAEFVSTEINYRSDPILGPDYIKTPQQTLKAGAGDCEDKTILVSSLLGTIGIPTVLVFEKHHVYPRACFDRPIKSAYLDSDLVHRFGKQYCYDLEPTAKGSGLGTSLDDQSQIESIVDVKTKALIQ